MAASAVLLCGCSPSPKKYSAVYTDVFDTATEFAAYCDSREEFDSYAEALHGELLRLHKIFDIYNEYDGLFNAASLNKTKSGGCPSELIELTKSAVDWYDLSGGKLNIALGSVLSLWHDSRESGVPPATEDLKPLAEHCDIGDISVEGDMISIQDPQLSLDFGAFAKGYAAEKAAELLESVGCADFVLSVGGNVVARGEKPGGSWEIGISSPDGGILTTVKVSDEAVVTSGDYQRYFEYEGVRYHHIIDPQTLMPANLWRSVTVICKSSADADALSTALFCLDEQSGRTLAEKFGAEALWVSSKGEVIRTEGFEDYEK